MRLLAMLAITVSLHRMDVGQSVTYTIETGSGVEITLPQEMTITHTAPGCIVQPMYHAYCVTDTLTITARLDRPPCGPIIADVLVADVVHVRAPSVEAVTQSCVFYLP